MRNKRYVRASKIKQSTILQLQPLGQCQWCGKDLTGHRKWWCSRVCKRSFYEYWLLVPKFKRAIYLRDDFKCQICGIELITHNAFGIEIPDLEKLSVDHIIPISKGGSNDPANLQCACRPCNFKKSDKIEEVY